MSTMLGMLRQAYKECLFLKDLAVAESRFEDANNLREYGLKLKSLLEHGERLSLPAK